MIWIELIYSSLTARRVNNIKVCNYCKFRAVKYNYKRHLSTIMHKTASRFISENEQNTTKKKTSNKTIFKLPFMSICHQTSNNVDGTRYIKKSDIMNERDRDQHQNEPCIGYLNQEEDIQTSRGRYTNKYHPFKNKLHLLLLFHLHL